MAKNTPAVLEDDAVEVEATPKQVINDGIARFIEETGIDGQKARYKAQRAIAFQAFLESMDADDFDALVDRAIAGADELPAGWGLERTVAEPKAEAPAKTKAAPKAKAAAGKRPVKGAGKTPAKAAGRRRPARSAE